MVRIDESKIRNELEEARAGLRVWISARTAAFLLGVHPNTLGEWRNRSPPRGPAWSKGSGPGACGANARIHYRYEVVMEWARNQAGRTAEQQRLTAELQRLKDRAREIEIELEMAEKKAEIKRLLRRLSYRRGQNMDTS